jgi:hypothetical protein
MRSRSSMFGFALGIGCGLLRAAKADRLWQQKDPVSHTSRRGALPDRDGAVRYRFGGDRQRSQDGCAGVVSESLHHARKGGDPECDGSKSSLAVPTEG